MAGSEGRERMALRARASCRRKKDGVLWAPAPATLREADVDKRVPSADGRELGSPRDTREGGAVTVVPGCIGNAESIGRIRPSCNAKASNCLKAKSMASAGVAGSGDLTGRS